MSGWERHCFLQRREIPGEASETYAAALHELRSDFNFGESNDKPRSDQLLEGAASPQTRALLLSEKTSLTFSHATALCRHTEPNYGS